MYTNVVDNNTVTFRVASFSRSTSLMKEVGKQWWQNQIMIGRRGGGGLGQA